MKNQSSLKMNVKKLLFISLIFLLLPCFAFGASTSIPAAKVKVPTESIRDAKVKKPLLQKQGIKLTGPQSTKPVLRSAVITNLRIDTEASGKWYWEATIRNTGNVELEGTRGWLSGYKVAFPANQNVWTGASGSFLGHPSPSLLPNQTRAIKVYITRCCKTDQLKVELKDYVTNKIWDTKILTSLTKTPYRPLDVRVKAIEWNEATKSWRATLKNFTGYTVTLSVIGVRVVPPNMAVGIPAGDSTITLGPNGEASSMWKNIGAAQQDDILVVRTVLRMLGSNFCNESDNDCGYQILDKIYLPNSQTFF